LARSHPCGKNFNDGRYGLGDVGPDDFGGEPVYSVSSRLTIMGCVPPSTATRHNGAAGSTMSEPPTASSNGDAQQVTLAFGGMCTSPGGPRSR